MDYFNIDSLFELIEKNKKHLCDEMDTITFENDKLSKESDKLLQILEYSPKTKLLERDIMKSLPIIKLKSGTEQKTAKKISKHSKLPSTPNIEFSLPKNMVAEDKTEIAHYIIDLIVDKVMEKIASKEADSQSNDSDDEYEKLMAQRQKQMEEREKKMEKINNQEDEDDDEYEKLMAQRQKQMEEREKKMEKINNQEDDDDDEYEKLMAQRQKQMEEREKKMEKINNQEDDEDDEYERLMAQRQKQMEERDKQRENGSDDDDFGTKKIKPIKNQDLSKGAIKQKGGRGTFTSRLSKAMNLMTKLKVYLFKTKTNFDINISPNDTIKSVKTQIINVLIENKYELKYTSENAYDIRIIEDGETEPNMDYAPLENNALIFMVKPKAIAFLENKKYNPNQDFSSEKLLGNVKIIKSNSCFYDKSSNKKNQNENVQINDGNNEVSDKMNIKIYYKANGINSSKIVSLSAEDNLKGILKIFFNQDILQYKNNDLYYFVEHKGSKEIDNAINLETNIKYLPSYELDLFYKNFPDLTEAMGAYNKGMMINSGNDKNAVKNENNDDGNSGGRDFFFNEISAGLYQEFEVVKINKFKSRQERILGIDMYNIYNNLPKKKPNGIMNFIFQEIKKPRRKMKNVKACGVIGDKSFYIDIKNDDNDEVKRSTYEVKTNLIRDEIVAKISFLIKLNQDNAN